MNYKKIKEIGFFACLCSVYILMLERTTMLLSYYYCGKYIFIIGAILWIIGILNEKDK